MFSKAVHFFLLIVFLLPSLSLAESSRYRQNRPQQDHKDFFGYNPKHSVKLERNPWGFHEFWWTGPDENGPYTLQVARDQEFKDLIYFQTVNRFYDFTRHLPDEAEVYWRVLYKDKKTPAYKVSLVPGKSHSIQIEEAKVTPFDFQNKVSGSILLKWSEAKGVGPYDIEVSPDPKFSTLVFRKRVRQQQYTIDKFAEAGQFYWRVKLGRFISPVGKFRINQSMVNAALLFSGPSIQLEYPHNGDAVDIEDKTIEFKWKGLGYETQYQIEVSRTGDFGEIVFSKEVGEDHVEVPMFSQQGPYFWRVSSTRYESPVYSFVLAPSSNILQKGFSLFRQILFVENEKSYFFSVDYLLSSLKGNDLDNSTAGTLVANQYIVLTAGMEKRLYKNWTFEWSADYSLIDREPPVGFTIRNPVKGLLGVQTGVENLLLKDFKAGLYLRYSEFEMAQTITGSFFEMNSLSALSMGGKADYNILKWSKVRSHVGVNFYSALPFSSAIGSALVSNFYMNFQFSLTSSIKSSVGLYYQNIGVVSDGASQSSDATGFKFKLDFN